jgi:hypothetical protein
MIIVTCPHCDEKIIIDKLNCLIFCHGVMKKTGKQINPHSDEKSCIKLLKKRLIYGCGKKFKIEKNGKDYITKKE